MTGPATVFVVDDDTGARDAVGSLIRSVGLHARLFESARDFLATEKPDAPACVVLDVRMPGLSGLDCQHRLLEAGFHIPIIFMTSHGDIPMSVHGAPTSARSQELRECPTFRS